MIQQDKNRQLSVSICCNYCYFLIKEHQHLIYQLSLFLFLSRSLVLSSPIFASCHGKGCHRGQKPCLQYDAIKLNQGVTIHCIIIGLALGYSSYKYQNMCSFDMTEIINFHLCVITPYYQIFCVGKNTAPLMIR